MKTETPMYLAVGGLWRRRRIVTSIRTMSTQWLRREADPGWKEDFGQKQGLLVFPSTVRGRKQGP